MLTSPMRSILEQDSRRARDIVKDVDAIIAEEEQKCFDAVTRRARNVVVKEFRRVAKRYKVKRIIFGNGTCLVDWDDNRQLGNNYHGPEAFPKGLRRLVHICDAIAYQYPLEDLTEADL